MCEGTLILIADVTIPNHMTYVQAVALFYSLLPFLLLIPALFILYFQRRLSFVLGFALLGGITVVIELILKPFFQGARPAESCALR